MPRGGSGEIKRPSVAAKKLPSDPQCRSESAARFAELNRLRNSREDDKLTSFDARVDAEGKPRFQGFRGFGRGGHSIRI